MHSRIDILGVKVSRVTLDLAQQEICGWIKQNERAYVCVAPVSTLVDAKQNAAYRDVVNKASMVTPDGMPVVWLAKAKGCQDVSRTYGPDLMKALCRTPGLRHYFFGGTSQTLELLKQNLKKNLADIKIVGMHSPEFTPEAKVEDQNIIDDINNAKADILWVALGSPKQDFWMSLNRSRITTPVIIGVGAAFDFHAGTKPQAPRFMQSAGLEWLFRLASEPKRLWKRYLVGNSLFVCYVIKDFFKKQHATS